MTTDITIRLALPTEAEALSDLTRRAKASHGYDDAFMRLVWDDMAIAPETIASNTVVVAERQGQILGWAHLMPVDQPDTVYLEHLFIEPESQGSGVGRLLFDWALTEAERRGYVWLEWDSDPNAVPFYRKMGGEVISETESTTFPGRMIPKYRKATAR